MDCNDLQKILRKYLDGKATAQEIAFLESYYAKAGGQTNALDQLDHEKMLLHKNEVTLKLNEHVNKLAESPVNAIHFLKTAWFRYAAAVVILSAIGAYFWSASKSDEQILANGTKELKTVVAPGGNKAVLTLADGTKVILDSAANGKLAQQGNAQVIKLADGQIAYNIKDISGQDVMWNTMSTPAGGQYKVTLPDGTRVWLNAASSITYPAAFLSKFRSVKITGEVYFEVAKDKEKPFIVDIDGKSTVEVLGTSFNINSYQDEGNIKTTLLEGKLKIGDSSESIILKPGQQAMVTADNKKSIVVSSSADLDQALAWKNNLFSFNDSDLRSVMKQLERWYDIQVKYEGKVTDITLKGKMYRNVNLSVVLDFLHKMGVRFRTQGKTVIVL